jgi:hypothetical protein
MTNGLEARKWLTRTSHPFALASNRFKTTNDALEFAKELYKAGALAGFVNDIRQEAEGGYTDTLFVKLPDDKPAREKIFTISNREARREGYFPARFLGA